jgi:tRNA 5-methylaminomethyl-2-thiouridine biosynthesis bifunctional protein
VSERLAARGWCIELIERHPAPAMEASAIPAGVFHPHVSRDDSQLSRLTRSGFLYAVGRWHALEAAGTRLPWAQCGVLQMAKDAREESRMAATVRALGFPDAYVDYLPRATAGQHAGRDVRAGGWWFPRSGWMRPDGLVAAQIAAARPALSLHRGAAVQALAWKDERWCALGADGTAIASAPVVILANSHDAPRLAPLAAPVKRVRGQLTCLPAGTLPELRAVLAGPGHVIPGAAGAAVAGATYDFGDEHPEPRAEGHAGNLARLEQLLGIGAHCHAAALDGAVGFRCVAADRLPLIGAMPDLPAAGSRPAVHTAQMPRAPGLYGAFAYASRGLTWAGLGGELIACLLEGEPLPIEADLADAIDPARFVLRRSRRGGL